MRHGGRIRSGVLGSCATLAVLAMSGCGGGSDFKDEPRPATPVQLTGVITRDRVTVSPNRTGAGPIVITVANETQTSHTLTLDGPNLRTPVQVGPINPLDTAQIQKTLRPGSYLVKAGSEKAVATEIRPARLTIGKARPESNTEVLQP